jgi:hypothetical protein
MLGSVLGIKFTILEGLVTNLGSQFLKGVKADSLFLEEYFLSKQNVKHPYLINLEFRSTPSNILNQFAERFGTIFHETYLGNYGYMFWLEGVFTYITCCFF